jgi:hypothetical protein
MNTPQAFYFAISQFSPSLADTQLQKNRSFFIQGSLDKVLCNKPEKN